MSEGEEIIDDILEQRRHIKIQKFVESLSIKGTNIKLYDRQLDLIKFYCYNWHKDEICINKSRQCGVSSITLGFILNECVKNKGKYLFTFKSHNGSNELEKINDLERMCVDSGIEFEKPFRNSIYINGNEITILQKIPFRLCEKRRIVCFFDEYAYSCEYKSIEESDKILANYDNVLRIYVSTPNGTNDFFDKWMYSKNKFKINWIDVPGRDSSWKDKMTDIIGSVEKFEQEFNNSFINI